MSRKPWPRLSETLPAPVSPDRCQRCGKDCDIARWQEHDDADQPEPVVVVLCDDCADEIIETHPRLYRAMERCEPMPGTMPACGDCHHRDGLRCAHPDLKANGGPGLPMRQPPPETWLACGAGQCDPFRVYHAWPTCLGHATGERHPVVIPIQWHLPRAGVTP